MSESETPVMPWEISLKNASWFIADHPDGGKVLKLVPIAPSPQGMVPLGVAVEVVFNKDGWEKFRADVQAGARGVSKVVIPQPGTNGHLN
jgi:hypothetical protein